MAGVIRSITQIDAHRKWTLTGGRNQVNRYRAVMHEANYGQGFRQLLERASLAYHTSDLGAIIELGRDGLGGPVRGLYNADSTRFRRTGNHEYPLEYFPNGGKGEPWHFTDFVLLVNQPQNLEELHGLGYSTVSRCIEVASTMIQVDRYDKESLGSRAPEGILFLNNVDESQWNSAMSGRERKLDGMERENYGGVAVIASSGTEQPSGTLLPLSQLPDRFDRQEFEDSLMSAYALACGYDVREFWPVSTGAFGSSVESETQHEKSTAKGRLSFALAFQEAMLSVFPDTLVFEFDMDDREGERIEAEVKNLVTNRVVTLFGNNLIDKEKALALLAMDEVIPEQWVSGDDTELNSTEGLKARNISRTVKQLREKALDNPLTREAISRSVDSKDNEIVMYVSPEAGRPYEVVLWDNGKDALTRKSWQGVSVGRRSGELGINDEMVQKAIATAERRLGGRYRNLLAPQDPQE